MKQVTQRLRDGKVSVIEVPPPALTADGVLVDVRASLLSAGTERAQIETGKQSLLGKARARPDQVRQVIEKAQRDGLRDTVQAVRSRLDQPSSLGYSCAGVAIAVGERVSDIVPGDRVACAGADHAVHADIVHVPGNLSARLPEGVGFDQGAYGTVGSIALHGVRQADVRLGERVAVIGLGLVGQLAGQILRAAGCTVVGIDLSRELTKRALSDGAADSVFVRSELGDDDPPARAAECDAVVITAAAKSSDPVELAARLCRDRGRVVIVGDVGMELPRRTYYDKELELRLSRSYGPGRYDREYEERGLDYPISYVRWTERRNIAAFLELLATGRVDVTSLTTERVQIADAEAAYERLMAAGGSPLGVLLEYGETIVQRSAPRTAGAARNTTVGTRLGVIGAGSFAQGTLIPSLKAAGFELVSVASASGRSAHAVGESFGFERTESPDELIAADDVDVVAIVSRHSSHADLSERALRAGKAVFVEKPPCLTRDELEQLRRAVEETGLPLVAGFNRRHASLARELRDTTRRGRNPFELLYRVNAGRLPDDHWLNDPADGGGRLLGEGCHFVDFACWFAGAPPERVTTVMRPDPGQPLAAAQSFSLTLDFADGSLATVFYSAGGGRPLDKEYVEVHSGGRSAVLDGYKRDKGHSAQATHLREVLAGSASLEAPGPLDSMAVTLAALRSAELGTTVALG